MAKNICINVSGSGHGTVSIDGEDVDHVRSLRFEAGVGKLSSLYLVGIYNGVTSHMEWRASWLGAMLIRNARGYDPYGSEVLG